MIDEMIKKLAEPPEIIGKNGEKMFVWLALKYITEQYFGEKSTVCKTGTPIEEEKTWKISLGEDIEAWEIFVYYDAGDWVTLDIVEAYKQAIEELGFLFLDFEFTKEEGKDGYMMYARVISIAEYEKLKKREEASEK